MPTQEQIDRYNKLKSQASGKDVSAEQQERYDRIKAETALENDTFQMETMIGNIGPDAWEAMKDFGYALAHPIQSIDAIGDTMMGGMATGLEAMGAPEQPVDKTQFDAMVQGMKDLGSSETWEDKPVRSLLNVLPVGRPLGAVTMGAKQGIRDAARGGANMAMDPVKLYRKSLDPKQAKSPGFAETNLEHGIVPMRQKTHDKKVVKLSKELDQSILDHKAGKLSDEAMLEKTVEVMDFGNLPVHKKPGLLRDALVKGVAGQALGHVIPIPGAAPTLTMAGVTHAVAKNPVVQARTAMFLKKMRELPKAKQGKLMDVLSMSVVPNLIQNTGEMVRPE